MANKKSFQNLWLDVSKVEKEVPAEKKVPVKKAPAPAAPKAKKAAAPKAEAKA